VPPGDSYRSSRHVERLLGVPPPALSILYRRENRQHPPFVSCCFVVLRFPACSGCGPHPLKLECTTATRRIVSPGLEQIVILLSHTGTLASFSLPLPSPPLPSPPPIPSLFFPLPPSHFSGFFAKFALPIPALFFVLSDPASLLSKEWSSRRCLHTKPCSL